MIARQQGCVESEAWRRVQSAIRNTYKEKAEQLAQIECDRMDKLIRRIEDQMDASEPGELPGLINAAVRISERRAKLLGLDAPKKIDLANTGTVEVVYVNDWQAAPEAATE